MENSKNGNHLSDETSIAFGEYLKLSDATKHCAYSQDYLNLLVRQKKLKAVRAGRSWLTTKAWLDEYGKRAEAWKARNSKKREAPGAVFLAPATADSGAEANSGGAAPVTRKISKLERQGNFYLWIGAFLFLFFFGFCVGRDEFSGAADDLSAVTNLHTGAQALHSSLPIGKINKSGTDDAGQVTGLERFSVMYANLHASPAMRDDSFYAFGDNVKKIVFLDEFGKYFSWLGRELARKCVL